MIEHSRRKTDNRFGSWVKEYQSEISIVVIATIFGVFLLWMLYSGMEARMHLQRQNIDLNSIILQQNAEIANLKSQLESYSSRQLILEPTPLVEQVVNKSSQELNHKIEKVQSALIQKKVEPSVIVKQETQVVEKGIPVDRELKDMMLNSYCKIAPDDPKCKVKK